MALRYYPSFRIQTNQSTTGGDYTVNGKPYAGKFYLTYDGKAYSGPDPLTGPNELLSPANVYQNSPLLTNQNIPKVVLNSIAAATSNKALITKTTTTQQGSQTVQPTNFYGPTPYYPYPVADDYSRGYIIRYFAKKTNNKGYVIEISPNEYDNIQNGNVPYDITLLQTISIFWKLTGNLNTKVISSYDVREGIIDCNKRLTTTAEKTFLGITDFIGGKYDKFAKPTT